MFIQEVLQKWEFFWMKKDFRRFYKSISFFNSNKSKIFGSEISIENEKNIVMVISFKLMPNHFHMKLREIEEGGVSKFMQKLLVSYSSYFNKKYDRFGAVFGSRFREKRIDSDEYSDYLDFYIKYNCIKLIRPDLEIYSIFCGEVNLSKEEQDFVNNYPFYFSVNNSSKL